LGERNAEGNKNKDNQRLKLIKNAYYIAINFSVFGFCIGHYNTYGIRIFIKLNKLSILYNLLTQIKKVYKINYKFRNVLNYGNKAFKWNRHIKYINS